MQKDKTVYMISLNHGCKIRILVVFPLSIVAGANVYADAAPNQAMFVIHQFSLLILIWLLVTRHMSIDRLLAKSYHVTCHAIIYIYTTIYIKQILQCSVYIYNCNIYAMFISFAELSNRMSRYSKCMLMLVKFSGKRKSEMKCSVVMTVAVVPD